MLRSPQQLHSLARKHTHSTSTSFARADGEYFLSLPAAAVASADAAFAAAARKLLLSVSTAASLSFPLSLSLSHARLDVLALITLAAVIVFVPGDFVVCGATGFADWLLLDGGGCLVVWKSTLMMTSRARISACISVQT
jgi:hypothetical protein